MVKLSRRGCWCLYSVPPNNCPPTRRWCTLEGNKCACVSFRGELRVVTTHPESIHTVLSLTMLLEIAYVFILCSSRTPTRTPTDSRPSLPPSQHLPVKRPTHPSPSRDHLLVWVQYFKLDRNRFLSNLFFKYYFSINLSFTLHNSVFGTDTFVK